MTETVIETNAEMLQWSRDEARARDKDGGGDIDRHGETKTGEETGTDGYGDENGQRQGRRQTMAEMETETNTEGDSWRQW